MIILSAIDAAGWVMIITSVFLGITTLAKMAFDFSREQAKLHRDAETALKVEAVRVQAEVAARRVGEVKAELVASNEVANHKLDDIAKTGNAVHVLVNSNMGVQLKISAVALRRVADLTNDDKDILAAKMAEDLLNAHEVKQATVDAKK